MKNDYIKYRKEAMQQLLKGKDMEKITGIIKAQGIEKDIIEEWIKNEDLAEVASKFNLSASTIRAQFSKIGVSESEIRRLSTALYVREYYPALKEEGLSNKEISERLNMSHHKLLAVIKAEGLYTPPINYVSDPDIIEEVLYYYEDGITQIAVAEAVGVSADTVSKILLQQGVREYTPSKLTEKEMNNLIKDYEDDASIEYIQKKYDVVSSTIYRILDWKGVGRRIPKYTEEEKEYFREQYIKGTPIKEIEDEMKILREKNRHQCDNNYDIEFISIRNRLRSWYGDKEYVEFTRLRDKNIIKPIYKAIELKGKGKIKSLEKFGISEQRYNAFVSMNFK